MMSGRRHWRWLQRGQNETVGWIKAIGRKGDWKGQGGNRGFFAKLKQINMR